jgi:hypothetical protein
VDENARFAPLVAMLTSERADIADLVKPSNIIGNWQRNRRNEGND